MLMRFDPFRVVDQAAQSWGQARTPAVPIDAYRQGDRFVVQVDLPGVDPASVDLTVDKNVLTLRAEQPEQADGQEWLVSERPRARSAASCSWERASTSTT